MVIVTLSHQSFRVNNDDIRKPLKIRNTEITENKWEKERERDRESCYHKCPNVGIVCVWLQWQILILNWRNYS